LKDRLKEKKYIVILSISLIVALLFTGCGKKGNPIPKNLPVPGGINDLKGEVKDGLLFLSFSAPAANKAGPGIPEGTAGFNVYKSCGSCLGTFELFKDLNIENGKGFLIQNGKVLFYDNDLKVGLQYRYKIYPYTKKGVQGDPSNIFTLVWENTPGPVKNLSIKEKDASIELSWEKEEGFQYNIYRYDNNVYPLIPLNKIPLTSSYFLSTGLENEKTYAYEVRKVQIKEGRMLEGRGIKTKAIPKDMTPPATPWQVMAEKKDNSVVLTWSENAEKDLAGYNIFRIGSGKAEKLNVEPLEKNIYSDNNLPDKRYVSYYVTSVDKKGNESDPSREVIIIIKE